MKHKIPTILLVEDNEDDVFAIQRALKFARVTNPLEVVTDGQAAIDYLSGAGQFTDRSRYPLPFMIFLDLKLPYIDGFEILTWMRQRAALQSIVVIVLTSSAETRDQDKTYELGARSYLTKPPSAQMLKELFDSLRSYWLSKSNASPLRTLPADPKERGTHNG